MKIEVDLTQRELQKLMRLAQRTGKDLTTLLTELVRDELTRFEEDSALGLTQDNWMQLLNKCIQLHPQAQRVDDSRVSIYDECNDDLSN